MAQSNNIFARFLSAQNKAVWLDNYIKYKREKRDLAREAIERRQIRREVSQRFSLSSESGLNLLLDANSLVDRSILEMGSWERHQVALLVSVARQLCKSSRVTFLDIGAYWGLYSLSMFKSGITDIVAFEPDKNNYAQLLSQLFLNEAISRIEVHNTALSSGVTRMNFKADYYGDGNRGTSRIVTDSACDVTTLTTKKLDDVFFEEGRSIVVKIDVEGHQDNVLMGMERTIKNNQVFLQVEIEDHAFASFDPIAKRLGLRRCGVIDVDHYYTNITSDLLTHTLRSSERFVPV